MPLKPFLAFSTAVATGAFFDASLGLAVGVGIATAIVSVVGWIRFAARLLDATAAQTDPLFPSPARIGADRPTN